MRRIMAQRITRYSLSEGPFNHLIDMTIEKAKNGGTESARTILRWFCGAIRANTDKVGKPYRKPSGTGTQIDERILCYLDECFRSILDDAPGARADANHALRLREARKRGSKRTTESRKRKLDIGYAVMERHAEIKTEEKSLKSPRLRGTPPLEEAIKDIATKYAVSEQTVKDGYDEWSKLIRTKM
jgi:hypothetical protein